MGFFSHLKLDMAENTLMGKFRNSKFNRFYEVAKNVSGKEHYKFFMSYFLEDDLKPYVINLITRALRDKKIRITIKSSIHFNSFNEDELYLNLMDLYLCQLLAAHPSPFVKTKMPMSPFKMVGSIMYLDHSCDLLKAQMDIVDNFHLIEEENGKQLELFYAKPAKKFIEFVNEFDNHYI